MDRRTELRRMLDFAAGARTEDGFGRLDDHGRLAGSGPGAESEAMVVARMAHCFAIGAREFGDPRWRALAGHGIAGLQRLRQPDWGFRSRAGDGPEAVRSGYDHCFIALAAATGVGQDIAGAADLLAAVLPDLDGALRVGPLVESLVGAGGELEDYLGANANMHAVEAFLAVAAATGEQRWLDRALAIATFFIDGAARAANWLLPEHFSRDGAVLADYSIDDPADEFRPYGVTIGHLFEWARLCRELAAALAEPPAWLIEAAEALYATGRRYGWAVDGADGFVYTVDFTGVPVVRQRMHWVACEAIAAATVAGVDADRDRWWAYAEQYLVDSEQGSWHHELDPANRPASTVFDGKPDAYHVVTALTAEPIAPVRPLSES